MIRGHINQGVLMWATSGILACLVGFGTWTVSQIHVTQVQAAAVNTDVEDLRSTVEKFQTSVDALNTKVDNSNHILDNIAGVLGIKKSIPSQVIYNEY